MSVLQPERGRPTPKRTFNRWVQNPVLEDYALRYAPKSFRLWSEWTVMNSALGGIAYMADFAIGGSVVLAYGFANAVTSILVVAAIIFLTGIPIAYYSAKYNIDMDLLTRGAGFGYYGSTLTSLVYASFTFIYFSLEGSVMAQALEEFFHIPLPVGYLICSLVIIPLVMFGMTALSKLQVITQPIWLVLMLGPFVAIALRDPSAFSQWTHFGGASASGSHFSPIEFGLAAGVTLSLIAQIGEQVDYLRFMPNLTPQNRGKWWLAVMLAGPGWVLLGAIKQLGGSLLASWIAPTMGTKAADEPINMYTQAFHVVMGNSYAALALATFFVLLSQIKINVTNAYSGSLSWSNFFSRIFHTHPGRVVWLFLNVGIALGLMEAGVFGFLNTVLGFYSNLAVAWIGAVVSDLVINKGLLKISPSYIEFKRGHLYNFNPVGFGSMILAAGVSIAAFFGAFGPVLQAYSPFLSLVLAFVLAPVIAIVTRGKYYIARENTFEKSDRHHDGHRHSELPAEFTCASCGFEYEKMDMLYCPFHKAPICSLCCSLESKCHDLCKAGHVH
ncbi:purine-cytosine permease family protein [Alicyclobacillus acidocaldarius]|uniref:Integral membrane sensor signal transduction histidine kinase n=1 Tax=Alicyclobacillus acidocaldarius subsp. acidocaldarius (strain ATCC 27009 / DSM 446 / BCRC 14685 / JCM 5260 / KCTC 1825 / NBRC 15652 / NCIMB 11725 / NRRL B-14509 / 104-IA) TaxID=521098 RepID=C8WRQ7_ALIAD|nr:allantoin permease [Alicyclobacillus acidocaldarius]ACV59318.1 integral membrane sensor signal transduction histidine kinase [Alicyclobacillus acidocaldarius subsp. acidocaldarius DSM 446]